MYALGEKRWDNRTTDGTRTKEKNGRELRRSVFIETTTTSTRIDKTDRLSVNLTEIIIPSEEQLKLLK